MRSVFFVLFGFVLINLGFAQGVKNEYWTSVSFSKKIIKKTSLALDFGYRFEDITENNTGLVEVGITRKLPLKLKLGLSYRYSDKSTFERKFRNVHRTSISLSKRFKVKKFKFSFRTKYQYEVKNQISRKNTDLTDHAWRNKLKVTKKVYKRTNLFLASEVFALEEVDFFSRYRFGGGAKYGITKRIEVSLQGVYEGFFDKSDQSNGIISLGYSQRF